MKVITFSGLAVLMWRYLITQLHEHVLGMATQLGPMYLLEIVPYNLKGAFGTACQLFCTIGIFVGSVYGLREILGKNLLVGE